MNQIQKRILLRLGSFTTVIMIIYITLLLYFQSIFSGIEFIELTLLISAISVLFLALLWLREKNLYYDYIMQRRISSGNSQYLLCPNCKVIQLKGTEICTNCKAEWIICRSCQVPFESGSKILISPCCGEGFHYDHFETELRENSRCPYCKSDLALQITDW